MALDFDVTFDGSGAADSARPVNELLLVVTVRTIDGIHR